MNDGRTKAVYAATKDMCDDLPMFFKLRIDKYNDKLLLIGEGVFDAAEFISSLS